MSFVITNLIIPSGCDDVIIHLKKLRTHGFFFRNKIENRQSFAQLPPLQQTKKSWKLGTITPSLFSNLTRHPVIGWKDRGHPDL